MSRRLSPSSWTRAGSASGPWPPIARSTMPASSVSAKGRGSRAASRLSTVTRGAYVMNLGPTPYREAWELQRALAAAVSQGTLPDTVVLLEHPPVVTLGRRTEASELHIPEDAEVEIVETDRGRSEEHTSELQSPDHLVC